MGTAGFVTALAASLLSLVISFIPVQFVNILMTLFLVFMTVMCRLLPERSNLKGCLVGCAVLTIVFRFTYMTTLGKLLYIVLMLAVIVGAVLMQKDINSRFTGGKKA